MSSKIEYAKRSITWVGNNQVFDNSDGRAAYEAAHAAWVATGSPPENTRTTPQPIWVGQTQIGLHNREEFEGKQYGGNW